MRFRRRGRDTSLVRHKTVLSQCIVDRLRAEAKEKNMSLRSEMESRVIDLLSSVRGGQGRIEPLLKDTSALVYNCAVCLGPRDTKTLLSYARKGNKSASHQLSELLQVSLERDIQRLEPSLGKEEVERQLKCAFEKPSRREDLRQALFLVKRALLGR